MLIKDHGGILNRYRSKINFCNLFFFKSVYRAYVKFLIDNDETEKAVKLFPLVYTTSAEWQEQILSFIQRDQLDVSSKKH
jgi:hypothetical protein